MKVRGDYKEAGEPSRCCMHLPHKHGVADGVPARRLNEDVMGICTPPVGLGACWFLCASHFADKSR